MSRRHKLFITGQIETIGLELLNKRSLDIDIAEAGSKISKEQLKQIVGSYDALLTMVADHIDEEILKAASPKLKIIANYGVGFDNIDVLAAKRRGIVVTNTPGVAGESVAEHTMMLILACSKRIIEADKFVRGGHYTGFDPKAFLSSQVWGQTLGIVGLGRIGTYVGHIAFSGFKMKVLYYDVTRSEDFEMLTDATFTSLDELLKRSDIVTIHAPLDAQTKHMISTEQFKKMKRSAILVNTARGPIVDQKALIETLVQKRILAAGLDVYEDEAHIPHELRILPNVVLTPHSASATYETREQMSKIAAQNIIDVFAGKTPFGLVSVS